MNKAIWDRCTVPSLGWTVLYIKEVMRPADTHTKTKNKQKNHL